MTGFHADPAALDALALRLEGTAEEYGAAAASVETAASGDFGPLAISGALAVLTGEWSGRIRAVETDFTTAASSVRAAAKAYGTTDAAAAEDLGRAADG
ncbi:type VII secretion target [Amycolatopsis sp. NPDC005961]|uniref:type VII secretion target n=1 Tax=Amycolatopsis TaxID=1813 RepID=UPI0012D78334|nr:type VII secretion target [Amycolatopsis camponoti]